jgi:hypothetical protein
VIEQCFIDSKYLSKCHERGLKNIFLNQGNAHSMYQSWRNVFLFSHNVVSLGIVFLLFLVMCSMPVMAHNQPQSRVLINFGENTVDIDLYLPIDRFEAALDQLQQVHPVPLTTISVLNSPSLLNYTHDYIQQRLSLRAPNGQVWQLQNIQFPQYPVSRVLNLNPMDDLHVVLRFIPPQNQPLRHFILIDHVLTQEIATHNALISVQHDWYNAQFADQPTLVDTLSLEHLSVEINQAQGGFLLGFQHVFKMGLSHIAEGYDHLLFLLCLLLTSALVATAQPKSWGAFKGTRQTVWHIAAIVTGFTLGHSLTLALGVYQILHLPVAVVESLIAVSIFITAGNAIRPIVSRNEFWLAIVFGLIHGLAFSQTLMEMGLTGWQLASGVLAFNLGIEVMQLLLVLLCLPLLIYFAKQSYYHKVKNTIAVFAIGLAVLWFVERAFAVQIFAVVLKQF